MKIKNNEKEFIFKYDGKEFVIPEGDFETNDSHFGSFLIKKAKQWKKDIVLIDASTETKITEPTIEKEATDEKKAKKSKK